MNCYTIENLMVGMEHQFKVTLTEEKMEAFCDICGDKNPLHMDKEYARSRGFENRVAYGMLTSTFISTMVGMYLPGKYSLIQSVTCDFLKPTYVGDELSIEAVLEKMNTNVKQVVLDIKIFNQNQIKILKGKVKVLVI